MIPVIPCRSVRAIGVPFVIGIFLGRLKGELGTQKLVQIFGYGKCLCNVYIHNVYGASDLDSGPDTQKASFRARMYLL